MIPRPFTCCCALLAIGSGFFLYTKKHQTTLLDQQISKIVADTERVRSQTAMLRTEWALENQPERLTRLAEQHLVGLHPMEPSQFVRMADLEKHLPPVSHDALPPQQVEAPVVAANTTALPAHITPPAPAAVTTVADARPAVAPRQAPVHAATLPENNQPHAATVVADAAPARVKPVVRAVIRHETVVADLDTPEAASRPAAVTPQRHTLRVATDQPRPVVQPAPVAVAALTTPALQPAVRPVVPVVSHVAPYKPHPTAVAEADIDQQVRHPLPVSVASWHASRARHTTAANTGYVEARANSSYGSGSLLGHGDDSLPPPVPMTN